MIGPISPREARLVSGAPIPQAVFDVFNELLAARYSSLIRITQAEVVALLVARNGYDRADIFRNGWLDVDQTYRNAGWAVRYDKPGHNESGEAAWRFEP